MSTVNMLDAKTRLSRLVEAVESGAGTEIIIARNGKPAAKLVKLSEPTKPGMRLGLLAGKFAPLSLENFNAEDDAIGRSFWRRPQVRSLLDAPGVSFLRSVQNWALRAARFPRIACILSTCLLGLVGLPAGASACGVKGTDLGGGGLHVDLTVTSGKDAFCGAVFVVSSEGAITERASHGTATYDGKMQFRYVPNQGYRGPDSFKINGLRQGKPVFMTISVTVE